MYEFVTLSVTLDEGATLPTRHSVGDAGLDLYLSSTEKIDRLWPGYVAKLNTGVRVAIPPGYVGKVEGRSSLASLNIQVLGGIIDSSYRGPIVVVLANHSLNVWSPERGKAIAQLVIYPIALPVPMLVDSLSDTERGSAGFGSSDKS